MNFFSCCFRSEENTHSVFEELKYLKHTLALHENVHDVVEIFKPQMFKWKLLSFDEKIKLMNSPGWALIFQYITQDPDTRKYTEIMVCRIKTHTLIEPKDYNLTLGEVHHKDCWRGMSNTFACNCPTV